MNDQEMRDLAEKILRDHAGEIEYLSIVEMVGDQLGWPEDSELTEDEFDELCANVDDLIRRAFVSIMWEDQ